MAKKSQGKEDPKDEVQENVQEQPTQDKKEPVTVAYEGYPAELEKAVKTKVQPLQDNWEIKDRTYVLVGRKTPVVVTIPVRHTQKRPLLWFDPEKRYQREIRYATNQRSVFVDEQEGHVTLAHCVIRNGSLTVPKEKQALQKLLSLYHPLKGVIYKELDERKIAEDKLVTMDLAFEAEAAARQMDIDEAEAIMRIEVGSAVRNMSVKEIKRDLRIFARNNPETFLQLANDENVVIRNVGIKAVEAGLIELAPDNRTFKWKSTGRILLTVPFDENPYSALAAFLKTDDGIEIYQSIEKRLG